MRILVCGGRGYRDWPALCKALDSLHPVPGVGLVIHGGARGADSLADCWASDRGIRREVYFPDWAGLGRRAGVMRNQRMLDEGRPDLVVAFPGGRGTVDMVRRARAAGVRVLEIV